MSDTSLRVISVISKF